MAQKNYSLEELNVDGIIRSPFLAIILFVIEEMAAEGSFLKGDLVKGCEEKYSFSEQKVSSALSQLIGKGYVFRKENSERYFFRKGRLENEREFLKLLVECE